MLKKTGLIVSILFLVVLTALALSGCGGGGAASSASSAPAKPTTTPSGESMSSIIANYSKLSANDVAAAQEALRCAEDANIGSTFKAMEVNCEKGWACVAVEEIDVPADESVGFNVYMKERSPGKWEVVRTGSGLTTDDIPGAPVEIFQN
ncbi:MAG: hypothetical protein ACYC99_10535 [Candidatus Geothermincolia bacterium]